MPTPPPYVPPTNTSVELGGPINNTVNPYQVQYVTPNSSELNQEQDQAAIGTGNASAYSAPQIIDSGTNAYTQVNTGYGENAEECMENVGCQTVPQIDFTAYYGRSDINSKVDSLTNAYSDSNNFGVQARIQIPLGKGFSGNLDKLAKAEVDKRSAEVIAQQQQNIANTIKLDEYVLKTCINLKNSSGGRRAVINIEKASPVMARIDAMCRGIDIYQVASTQRQSSNDDIKALIEENRRLREKINQLMKTNIPQKVGN